MLLIRHTLDFWNLGQVELSAFVGPRRMWQRSFTETLLSTCFPRPTELFSLRDLTSAGCLMVVRRDKLSALPCYKCNHTPILSYVTN